MSRPALLFPADLAALTDAEIARQLGVRRSRVLRARHRAGIAPRPTGRQPIPTGTAADQVERFVLAHGSARVKALLVLPFAENTIRRTLRDLVEAGRLRRVAWGLYEAFPAGPTHHAAILALLVKHPGESLSASRIAKLLEADRATIGSALLRLHMAESVVRSGERMKYRYAAAPSVLAAASAAPSPFAAGLAVGRAA